MRTSCGVKRWLWGVCSLPLHGGPGLDQFKLVPVILDSNDKPVMSHGPKKTARTSQNIQTSQIIPLLSICPSPQTLDSSFGRASVQVLAQHGSMCIWLCSGETSNVWYIANTQLCCNGGFEISRSALVCIQADCGWISQLQVAYSPHNEQNVHFFLFSPHVMLIIASCTF